MNKQAGKGSSLFKCSEWQKVHSVSSHLIIYKTQHPSKVQQQNSNSILIFFSINISQPQDINSHKIRFH